MRRIAGAWLVLAATATPAAAHAQAQDNPAAVRHDYDIPAERLSIALAAFSQASGIDVLLDEPQAAGRQSSAVRGRYAPPQALTLLLAGTGLVARFTSRRSAIIVPRARADAPLAPRAGDAGPVIALDMMTVTAPRTIGGARRPADTGYLLALAGAIRRAIVAAGLIGGSERPRLRIATRIDGNGALHAVAVAVPSGDARRDGRIVALLEGRQLAPAPPAGLRQPILFDVVAQ